MAQMQKTQKQNKHYTNEEFFTKSKKKQEIFAFCVITFEPIEIQTRSAPQNDRLNLSFVKDLHLVFEKMARNGRKTAIYLSQILVNSLYH
jgi:hypothetical protein